MVKPPLRRKSIGFKVSEEEYAQLEEAARAGGFTLGEWCRQVVLEDASGEEIKPAGTGRVAHSFAFFANEWGMLSLDEVILHYDYSLLYWKTCGKPPKRKAWLSISLST